MSRHGSFAHIASLPLLVVLLLSFQNSSVANLSELDDSNADKVFEGSWLVMFYAPWCPACQSLKAPWRDLASKERIDGLKIAQVDVNEYPALSGQFLIFNLPSIFYIHDGVVRQYYGINQMSAISSWLADGTYKTVDPVSSWRSPNSLLMKAVGKFFHFANYIRTLKGVLTDEYGVPSWAAYSVFVLATILIGLTVGLTIVCLCDCLFPPRPSIIEEKTLTEESEPEEDNEGGGDDNKDKKSKKKEKPANTDTSENKQVRKRKPNKQ